MTNTNLEKSKQTKEEKKTQEIRKEIQGTAKNILFLIYEERKDQDDC